MRSRKRPVMLWFLPVGFTGVLVQNALFSWHIAFFIEESPLKDSTVQTTCAVYRPVLKRVPLYAINVGCRHNSPKKPTKLLWFLATVIICAQFRQFNLKSTNLSCLTLAKRGTSQFRLHSQCASRKTMTSPVAYLAPIVRVLKRTKN